MAETYHVDYLWALDTAAELVQQVGAEVQKTDVEAAKELSLVVIALKTLQAQIEYDRMPKKQRRLN
jgi:hypothetical protein